MNICKYCGNALIPYTIYNTCNNPKCYFYAVLVIPYKSDPKIKPVVKKGKFDTFKETAVTMFKDIKDEMGKTMSETGAALNEVNEKVNGPKNSSKKSKNQDDPFATPFGEMDAGGL